MKNPLSERILIILAFAAIYIIWGSTHLANWFAIRDIPTFLMCGSRFFTAGAVLFVGSLLFGAELPKWAHWKSTAFLGFFFFFLGNGAAVWGLNYVDSSICALIIASQPLVTVLMMWALLGQRPSTITFSGVFLGLIGMYFLVNQDRFTANKMVVVGMAVIFMAVTGWGYASIKISQIPLPRSKAMGAAMQMLLGGTMLLVLSFSMGEAVTFNLDKVTLRGALSFAYLIIFGAIIAFSAFNYLLLKTTPDKVATSTYVNPVVALFLGWSLNNEIITTQSLSAAALLLAGMIFIRWNKRGQQIGAAKQRTPEGD